MYIHLKTLLEFIEIREGREFKIIKSEDLGVPKGHSDSFKIFIPKEYNIDKQKDNTKDYNSYLEIKDEGGTVVELPPIHLYDVELYNTKDEDRVLVEGKGFEEGLVLFENFNNIPMLISAGDVTRTLDGLQEV